MKIDFIVDSLVPGGAERVLVLLANYFERQGHDVSIITFNDKEVWEPSKTIKRIKLHHGKIKNQMIRCVKVLGQYYYNKKNRPDVIISFMTRTNLNAIIIAKLYNIKIIASEHNNHLKKIDRIGHYTRKYVYKYSNALTVLTNFDKQYYIKRKVNAYVMPNPCTFDLYQEPTRNRNKTILAVGALNRYHHKGFDNLIPIVAPVLKRNPDWNLKLVGGGKKGMQLLKDLTEKHDIKDQVIFEGFSKEVSRIMRESEIYIMTSRFEGLPMVLIEAMSQGLACISYNCTTGPSDIINHNENGILVEDQNHQAMGEELEKLMNNPQRREQLSNNAINSLDRFKIDNIYKRYLKIFDEIL